MSKSIRKWQVRTKEVWARSNDGGCVMAALINAVRFLCSIDAETDIESRVKTLNLLSLRWQHRCRSGEVGLSCVEYIWVLLDR